MIWTDCWKTNKQELRFNIQGIIKVNAQAHKYMAEVANHLVDAWRLLTTPGIVTLADSMMRPVVGIHLPL